MNSLEFIDEEIKFCQAKINKAHQDNIYQQTMALLILENKNIDFALLNNFHISLNETKIKYLNQIKSELEAWYSVKKGLKIKEGKVDDDSFFEYLEFEDELFDENQYEYAYLNLKPIKKALEVEDE